jgi:peptidoglycan/xylan/chitin deacetylase (PgdA/CDA1 family)
MKLRRILKHTIPDPVRRLGWRGYYHTRDNWLKPRLKTIVSCQTSQKIVALTFDDGPNPTYTPQILEVLAHFQVKATFFLLGRNVAAHPKTVHAVVEAGHAIGNHTFNHPYLADCTPAEVISELSQCQRTIREVVGIVPKVMRPPFGAQSPECLA